MKKLLVIYSREGDLRKIAEGIKEGAEQNGYQVDLQNTERQSRPLNFHPYDLVVVGSPTHGFFRGSIAEDLPGFLKDCKRTQGQEVVVFVTPSFFATTRALKKLMSELEKLGCIVNDFRSLSGHTQGVDFGRKL